eukprot:m.464058 g.464058  ORF g.464058 m.464058 type:complete len:429 (-) comp23296_c0_seq1:369-1655(-)
MASHEKVDLGGGRGSPVNRWVYALFIVFGLGSWITINGLFAELRLFSDDLPEKSQIYADLGLAIQVANIVPLIYSTFRPPGTPVRATTAVLVVGAVAIAVTGALWKHTTMIAGKETSAALIGGVFVSAAVDCTTTLLFWPFVAEFKSQHVTALAIGEGSTGIVATLLVTIQLRGKLGTDNLLFPVSVYFGLMAGVVLLSLAAFGILVNQPFAQADRVQIGEDVGSPTYERLLNAESDTDNDVDTIAMSTGALGRHRGKDPNRKHLRLFLMLAWLSAMQNGIKPAVMPYAITDSATFELAQLAGLCVDPVGGVVALWLIPTVSVQVFLGFIWTACVGSLFAAAVVSDLREGRGGAVLAAASIGSSFLLSYSKASALLRIKRSPRGPRAAEVGPSSSLSLFRAGACIQSGSFVGAMTMWLVVHYAGIFHY